MLKIVFVSGVIFGYRCLDALIKDNWKIEAVFSYDDLLGDRFSDYCNFDVICSKHNIPNYKVKNINNELSITKMKELRPDIILVMGWSQIIKKEIINCAKYVIGSHPTKLPLYRGRAPVPWSILKGLTSSAETLFYIDEDVDSGDILDQKEFEITGDDDAESVYDKVSNSAIEMLLRNLPLFEKGTQQRIKQDQTQFLEYWPKRNPEDGLIIWNRSANEINRLIRATTKPYPGAFTFLGGQKIIIWKSIVLDSYPPSKGEAGEILDINQNGMVIRCGSKYIIATVISTTALHYKRPIDIFGFKEIGKILG